MQFFTRVPVALSILATATMAGGAVYLVELPAPIPMVAPEIAMDVPEPISLPAIEPVTAYEPAPEVAPFAPNAFAFVFVAGGQRYVQVSLESVDSMFDAKDLPIKRGKLVTDDYVTAAVAPLAITDVPDAIRPWLGSKMRVGADCVTTIDGFAHVARLTGDPGYAGLGDSAKWTAATTFENGTNMLAARLDGACDGTYARAEALAPMPQVYEMADANPALIAEARADLFASDVATSTDDEWADPAYGTPAETSWRDEAKPDARVFHHAATNETWVIVHARVAGGCGDRSANVLGVYRVGADGKLIRELASSSTGIDQIETAVDVDGDGTIELLGKSWLGPEHELLRLDAADPIRTIDVPFFGCNC